MAAQRTKNRLIVVLTFALGAAVGAALTAGWRATATPNRPGNTLVGFDPDAVLSLTYRWRAGMFTAQRSQEGAPFAVQSTFAAGSATEHCVAPVDLAGALPAFSEFIVKRSLTLTEREHEFPLQIGVLDIQTIGIAEPTNPILVFANQRNTSVAVIVDGVAAEVTLAPSTFAKLEHGCAALAPK